MRNDEDWFRVLVACQVKPTVAARWSGGFSAVVQPERFSKGEAEIPIWLSQILHESAQLTRLEENLNYSAKRLTEVWPTRFPTLAAAEPFANNPQALANKVYGGRLGNTGPNDGWLYRGRGLIQVTGKGNHELLGKQMKLDLVAAPELLSLPKVAIESSILWWEGNVPDSILGDQVKVRRRVNGGTVGLEETKKLAAVAEKAMQA